MICTMEKRAINQILNCVYMIPCDAMWTSEREREREWNANEWQLTVYLELGLLLVLLLWFGREWAAQYKMNFENF